MTKTKRSIHQPPARLRVDCFVLCDYVRVAGGKLDILGAGWDLVSPPTLPLPYRFSIALKMVAPLGIAAQGLPLRIDLVDESGRGMEPAPGTLLLRAVPDDGSSPDDDLPLMVPIGVELTLVLPGKYTFRLSWEDTVIAETTFRVAEAPLPEIAVSDGGPEELRDPAVSGPIE